VFELHPKLCQDCHELGRFPLSRLLLMNDSRFPWFILVPERRDIREIFQLTEADRMQLLRESCHLSACIEEVFQPDKLNIAAIGNLVPQLHIHHIARYRTDPLWPAPVWGSGPAVPYSVAGLEELRVRFSSRLGEAFEPMAPG
jgi:diadenosine tetraphosphate (Ap4A) HIT family hydrolase